MPANRRRKFFRWRATSVAPPGCGSIIISPRRARMRTRAVTRSRRNCSPGNTKSCGAGSCDLDRRDHHWRDLLDGDIEHLESEIAGAGLTSNRLGVHPLLGLGPLRGDQGVEFSLVQLPLAQLDQPLLEVCGILLRELARIALRLLKETLELVLRCLDGIVFDSV